MKKLFIFIILCTGISGIFAFNFEENFDYTYGQYITDNSWSQVGSSIFNPIVIGSENLQWSNYPLENGNSVILNTTGQDVSKAFSTESIASGTIYLSFLVKITSANLTGDYFISLKQESSSNYYGRIFVKRDDYNSLAFGILKQSGFTVYTDFNYALNTTYFIVLKYNFNDLDTDLASLWINPAYGETLPEPLISDNSGSYNATSLKEILLRQGTSSNAPSVIVDGIKVSDVWYSAPVTVAPMIESFSPLTVPPYEYQDYPVEAIVTDADGDLASVEIGVKINGGPAQYFPMTNSGYNYFTGKIPHSAYQNGDKTEYWIRAKDAVSGNIIHTVESVSYKFSAGITPLQLIRNNDQNGISVYENFLCRIQGTAVSKDGTFNPITSIDAFLIDGDFGISAYKPINDLGVQIVENNSYSIIGTIANYYGKTEILVNSIANLGILNPVSPLSITLEQLNSYPEIYEGRLIKISNVHIVSGTWPVSNRNALLIIGESGSPYQMSLYIDKDTDIDGTPIPEFPLQLTGIFSQYTTAQPYFLGYQILPRGTSDFNQDQTLPVTFSSFTASLNQNHSVSLHWITQSESNLIGYSVYRNTSEDHSSAQRISSIINAGNSSNETHYNFTDNETQENNNYYYWIVVNELNGQSSWYGHVNINTYNNENPIIPPLTSMGNTYPNPLRLSSGFVSLEVDVKDNETANLSVFNAKGQLIQSFTNLTPGSHLVKWDGKDKHGIRCSNGVYFFKLTSPSAISVRKSMILK